MENITNNTLTVENYYSQEMNKEYMSVSQLKGFMTCEAKEMAKLSGEYTPVDTTALLQGRLLETLLLEPQKIKQFMEENPELFLKNGSIKSEHRKVLEMAERAKKDKVFMDFIGDEFTTDYQYLVQGEIGGVNFKGLIDIYQPGVRIVDLKGVKDFAPIWDSNKGRKLNFISYWGYDMQLAVYQELLRQKTGEILPVYIAGITKEIVPDIGIFEIPQDYLDKKLTEVIELAQRFQLIKNGEGEAHRCESCDYCKSTKELSGPIIFEDFFHFHDDF